MTSEHRVQAENRPADWAAEGPHGPAAPSSGERPPLATGAAASSPRAAVVGEPQVRPDFIILGAQKSASTFLHHCLAQHPEIFVAPGEVPIFEDPDFAGYRPDFFAELFRGRVERCLGIRRPNYLGRSEVPPRIAETLPDVKLIAVLRNPVDRAVSSAFHQMSASFIPVMDIEACMTALLKGELQRRYPRSWQILEFGRYHKCLSMYASFLERKLMFVISQEQFLQDKQGILRELFRFLGVDDGFVPPDLVSRKQPGHYHPLTQHMARLANNISQYRDEGNLRAHPRGPAARFAGRCLTRVADIIEAKMFKDVQPRISDRCRAELSAYYREDIENLERLTGWDCSAWKAVGKAG